jgi:photosystem II stability/assembly factor-like uncharacterized protein
LAFWDWIEKIAAKQWRAGKDALPVEITKGVAVADVDPSTSRLKVDAQLTGSIVEEDAIRVRHANEYQDGFLSIRRRANYYPKRAKPEYKVLLDIADLGFESGTYGPVWPLWMGQDGDKVLMLAKGISSNTAIHYSEDCGETWVRTCASGKFNYPQYGFVTPSPNRSMIICDRRPGGVYKIYRSTNFESDNHSNWVEKVVADAGYFSSRYGLSVRENVIAITTYGVPDQTNPPRFLYLSRDSGETWETIEVAKVSDMVDPGDFHLHDVEYDPWANRLWVSNGDRVNSALQYSDDWGKTWNLVAPRGVAVAGQATSITALPDRVLFGSDGKPNGFFVWYRKWQENSAPVSEHDIKFLYTPDDIANEGHLSVANISHTQMDAAFFEYPYTLVLPFEKSTAGSDFPLRLLASPDGEHFYEIFRVDQISHDLGNATLARLIGPVPGHKYMYLSVYHHSKGSFWVKIEKPEWVKVD